VFDDKYTTTTTAKAEEARYHRDIAQLETEKVRLEKEKIE